MLTRIAGVSLLVALVVIGTVALRAEPVWVWGYCMDVTDHEAREANSADCQSRAEAAGYAHGILRFSPQGKCAVGEHSPVKPFDCVGVGPGEPAE